MYEETFIHSRLLPHESRLLSPGKYAFVDIKNYIAELRKNLGAYNLPDGFDQHISSVASIDEVDALLKNINYGLTTLPNSKTQKAIEALQTRVSRLVVKAVDFHSPAEEIQDENGTFYELAATDENPGSRTGMWIGKLLDQKLLALDFYDKLATCTENSDEYKLFSAGGARTFGGLIRMQCKLLSGKTEARNLFLSQNFFQMRYTELRRIQFTMGAITAIKNWRAVSGLQAWKANKLASESNSAVENCRIDHVNFPSQVLTHYLSVSTQHRPVSLALLGVKRAQLQRMPLHKILPYVLDLRMDGAERFKQSEVYLHSTLLRLTNAMFNYELALRKITVPQKWVASKLSLGFDTGGTEDLRSDHVECRAHGWDMSTIMSRQDYDRLPIAEQKEQQKIWDNYINGVANINYELMRYTYNRVLCPKFTACVFELETVKDGHLHAYAMLESTDAASYTIYWNFTDAKLNKKINQATGKGKEGKRMWSNVTITTHANNTRIALQDICNMPHSILKLSNVSIHLLSFQYHKAAALYTNVLKAIRSTSIINPIRGRIFSQPSRVFNHFQDQDAMISENYFISSHTVTDGSVLKFDDSTSPWYSTPYPPHIRDLSILKIDRNTFSLDGDKE